MSYPVFQVRRGRALHIIHETATRCSLSGVHLLCKAGEASFGDRVKGVPTCPKCLALDNPCTLSDAERSMLARFATQADGMPRWRGQAVTSLHQKDLIDKDERLTRRGEILAQDWRVGPAPAADRAGVVHARTPLSSWPRCVGPLFARKLDAAARKLDGFHDMTVDKYARIRALDLSVTCVHCAADRRA